MPKVQSQPAREQSAAGRCTVRIWKMLTMGLIVVAATAPSTVSACVPPLALATAAWGRCAIHAVRASGNSRLLDAMQSSMTPNVRARWRTVLRTRITPRCGGFDQVVRRDRAWARQARPGTEYNFQSEPDQAIIFALHQPQRRAHHAQSHC